MFTKLVFCSLLTTSCLSSFLNHKIVNGTNAAQGEFPYIVSLRKNGRHSCGASILDATHVLTAAHCVQTSVQGISIQYGVTDITSDDVNSIDVDSIIYHEDFVPGNGYINDVAVMKLSSPIPLGENIKHTILPPANNATPANQNAVLIGWGRPYTDGSVMKKLQKVDIMVFSDEDCKNAHGALVSEAYHVCAGIPEGGKGQCNGDSGGPLTVNGVQVGIVSWSVKPCTVKGFPGVFCKVANYVDWINDKIANM